LREQLARRDDQIESLTRALDQNQQLLAVQTKTSAQLSERLQLLEDRRKQSWIKRVFRLA